MKLVSPDLDINNTGVKAIAEFELAKDGFRGYMREFFLLNSRKLLKYYINYKLYSILLIYFT